MKRVASQIKDDKKFKNYGKKKRKEKFAKETQDLSSFNYKFKS
jgi:hypothetical protein